MGNLLGQIMVNNGVISDEQLEEAIQAQVVFGGRLGTNLVELGYSDLNQLGNSLAELHKLPILDQNHIKACPQVALNTLGKKLASKYQCVPLSMDKTSINVLMANPSDFEAIDEIGYATGRRVKVHVAPELVVLTLLEKYYQIARPMRYVSIGQFQGLKKKTKETKPAPKKVEVTKRKGATKETTKETEDLDFQKYAAEKSDEPDMSQYEEIPEPLQKEEEPDWSQFEEEDAVEEETIELLEESEEVEVLDLEELIQETPLVELTETVEEDSVEEEAEELQLIEALPEMLTLAEATARLDGVSDRDELSHIVLSFAQSYFKRSALFITRFNRVIGWYGMGGGITPDKVKSIMMPLSEPSIFKTVHDSQAFYLGAVPETPINDLFMKSMDSEKPSSVFLIPIHFHGQVVNILYGDNGDGQQAPFDISELLILAPKVPQAFEQIIRNKKAQAAIDLLMTDQI